MKTNSRLIFTLLIITILLFACGRKEKFKDLYDYVDKLTQDSVVKKQQNASDTLPQSNQSSYHKESSRTPFEEIDAMKGQANISNDPLSAYSLTLLRFIGTVSQNDNVSAYIMTPDNKVYLVKIGDTIGDHNGKITKISPNELQVVEQSLEDGKAGAQRIVTLQLKEGG
jgi:Tfp pilus assembly protein PilP